MRLTTHIPSFCGCLLLKGRSALSRLSRLSRMSRLSRSRSLLSRLSRWLSRLSGRSCWLPRSWYGFWLGPPSMRRFPPNCPGKSGSTRQGRISNGSQIAPMVKHELYALSCSYPFQSDYYSNRNQVHLLSVKLY